MLTKCDIDLCQIAYKLLQEQGYFNDEQIYSSYLIKYKFSEMKEYLRKLGYQGTLHKNGKYYGEYGAIYWVYDLDKVSYEESFEKITEYLKSKI